MITIVNQVSSVWFDNKLLRKSLHDEKKFYKCEFTAKNSVNSSISLLILCKIADKNRQNFVGFDCRSFPLGLNTLDTDAPYSTDINTYGLYIYIYKKTRAFVWSSGTFLYLQWQFFHFLYPTIHARWPFISFG